VTVTAPKDGAEMLGLLRAGLAHESGPFSLRYPRDVVPAPVPDVADIAPVPYGTWEVLRQGSELAILAVGTMVGNALRAAETLAEEGLDVTVVNCRFLKPYDEVTLAAILAQHRQILVVEEGTVVNGFGAYIAAVIERHDSSVRVHTHGVPDRIIYAAPRTKQLAALGLDAPGIARRVRALYESEALAG
jgi:1-deoxy-D-xylulose-5-phosphate synthase